RSTAPGAAAEPCRAPPDAFAAAVLEDADTALAPLSMRRLSARTCIQPTTDRTVRSGQGKPQPRRPPHPACGRGARLNSLRQTHHTSSANDRLTATTIASASQG